MEDVGHSSQDKDMRKHVLKGDKQAVHKGQMTANRKKTVEGVGHPKQGAGNCSRHTITSTE